MALGWVVAASVLSSLGAFLFGLDIGYIAPILECESFKHDVAKLENWWDPQSKIHSETAGFIVGVFSIGCICVSFPPVSSYFLDVWGRKASIILGSFIFLAGCWVQVGDPAVLELLAYGYLEAQHANAARAADEGRQLGFVLLAFIWVYGDLSNRLPVRAPANVRGRKGEDETVFDFVMSEFETEPTALNLQLLPESSSTSADDGIFAPIRLYEAHFEDVRFVPHTGRSSLAESL
ncbi:hypothetical protein AK812_SmicGene11096 [Symbiodinium microadriaticum]|uniref:Major facilitator superfamily (MFS) profile domain-containing protein n=1 Tax=Symbiodinium microadriaticum TaxID=2951 RepID=A0A1Q9EE62_SYMMI|nr:hypothetical protein AK812_SmicGene11096 [Symbiodinium microadriaticum]